MLKPAAVTPAAAPEVPARRLFACMALLAAVLIGAPASAVVTIEVTRGVESAIPIAVVPFAAGDSGAAFSELPVEVIEDNLARSGKFAPLAREDFLDWPHAADDVQYKDWRLLKAEALVVGRVVTLPDGRAEVRFQLLDVFRGKRWAEEIFVVDADKLRVAAHKISDLIYEALLGRPGAFDSRIAFVKKTPKDCLHPRCHYELQVADADGHSPKTILNSNREILSLAWAPDGDQLAYVSFEKNRSVIFVQDLYSGSRVAVARHTGINGAPAWSPDGNQLAMTLSKDGNPEIYVYDLSSRELRRLTRHAARDTEPAWSPDGGTIAFTSDRSGKPQIYRVAAGGGDAQQLTHAGEYNAGATYSSDGKSIVLITNQGSGFRVGVYSAVDRSVTPLTETSQDESPTFAPNDEMIMYATQLGGRNVLAVVSPDGGVRRILELPEGDYREPAWSPFNQKQ